LLLAKQQGLIPAVKPLFQQLCEQGYRIASAILQTALIDAGEAG